MSKLWSFSMITFPQIIIGLAICLWILIIFTLAATSSAKTERLNRTEKLKQSLKGLLEILKR